MFGYLVQGAHALAPLYAPELQDALKKDLLQERMVGFLVLAQHQRGLVMERWESAHSALQADLMGRATQRRVAAVVMDHWLLLQALPHHKPLVVDRAHSQVAFQVKMEVAALPF